MKTRKAVRSILATVPAFGGNGMRQDEGDAAVRRLENQSFLLLLVAVTLAFSWILAPYYGAVILRRSKASGKRKTSLNGLVISTMGLLNSELIGGNVNVRLDLGDRMFTSEDSVQLQQLLLKLVH